MEKHPDQLELHLMNMTESERRQWIRDQRNGWNPPELDFEIRGEKYHCMRPFPIPPKNEDAVMAKCNHMDAAVCEIWGPSRLQTPEALKLPRGPWCYKIGVHEALLRSLAPG